MMIGRKPILNAQQARYLRLVPAIRRKLSDKSIAARYGISVETVRRYTRGGNKNYAGLG